MKKIFIIIFSLSFYLFTGCSHNPGAFTIGTRAFVGIDPQNFSADVSYTDGVNVIDVARENSGWKVNIDSSTGIMVDDKTGGIKGIKSMERITGPQFSGYMRDVAEKDPTIVKEYFKAVQAFWEYQKSCTNNSGEEK